MMKGICINTNNAYFFKKLDQNLACLKEDKYINIVLPAMLYKMTCAF